ncbi:MAG: hypothetical protein IJG00_02985 [Clostridia bacterium]|nr:hypothetical protein [Clostridia bacterium]
MELDIAFNEEPYDFDSYMEKLNNELKKKEAEIEEAKKRVAELLAAKIYTRKELKQINEEKIRRENEKKEYEKKNIDLITMQSLSIAKDLRDNVEGLSEEEKKEVEISAMTIERSAFEKEIKVKKDIIKEKETQMNKILADKVFYESKIKKIRKDMNAGNSSESKVKIETLKNYSKNNSKQYFEFLKQNEILKDSVIKAQNQIGFLKEKLNLSAQK